MAVSIMSACCRASVLSLHLLVCFLQVFSQGEVFVQETQANAVLVRSRRANMYLLEEILQGNLERECFEELCNYEEAREYFEDKEKTMAFWTVYYDGDQCESNPCLNGGNCTDKVGGFYCLCTPPHSGPFCELGAVEELGSSSVTSQHAADVAECPTEGPTACHQLCMASHFSFTCSCLPGFKLHTDKRSCVPEVDFPCGRLPDKFNSTESLCRHGNCPWQVPLLNSQEAPLCAGVVLGHRSILTAASCLFLDSGLKLRPSSLFVVAGNNELVPVQALHVHDRFIPDHHDNDLALLELAKPLTFDPTLIHLCVPKKDFSENILMHAGRTGVAGGWRSERHEDLVYMTLDECRDQMNVSHQLSNKMFCMSRQIGQTVRQSAAPRGRGRPGRNHNEAPQSRAPNGSDSQNSSRSKVDLQRPSVSDGGLRSEVSRRRSGRLLPGLPVATVEKGTAFLTGLLISPSTGRHGRSGGGLIFTKVSRHLSWIRPRLEAAEDHMTLQVIQYPETR